MGSPPRIRRGKGVEEMGTPSSNDLGLQEKEEEAKKQFLSSLHNFQLHTKNYPLSPQSPSILLDLFVNYLRPQLKYCTRPVVVARHNGPFISSRNMHLAFVSTDCPSRKHRLDIDRNGNFYAFEVEVIPGGSIDLKSSYITVVRELHQDSVLSHFDVRGWGPCQFRIEDILRGLHDILWRVRLERERALAAMKIREDGLYQGLYLFGLSPD